MVKPTPPIAPEAPLRSDAAFSAKAQTFLNWLSGGFYSYVGDAVDFVDERADEALAAATTFGFPSIAGKALNFTRVNAGATALEFRTPAQVRSDIGATAIGASVFTAADAAAARAALNLDQFRGFNFSAAQSTASGTAFDFTGIPSWATEIIVQFFAISLSGTDHLAVQFGVAGSVVATGYVGSSGAINLTACSAISGTGAFVLLSGNAGFAVSGEMRLSQVFANGWVQSHTAHLTSNAISTGGGSINLAGPPDRIRLTRTGTDTFDAGSVRVGWR